MPAQLMVVLAFFIAFEACFALNTKRLIYTCPLPSMLRHSIQAAKSVLGLFKSDQETLKKSSGSGGKAPTHFENYLNQLGIYHMSGNVWEWCEADWKGASIRKISPPLILKLLLLVIQRILLLRKAVKDFSDTR